MTYKSIKVLLVEPNPADAEAVVNLLTETTSEVYIDCVDCVSTALSRLALGDIDVVLLDLTSTGGEGLRRFATLQSQRPDIPIIVLADRDSERLAMHAMRDGAKGHLLKESVNGQEVARRLERATKPQSVNASYSVSSP